MQCPRCEIEVAAWAKKCHACAAVIPPSQRLLDESGILQPARPITPVARAAAVCQVATLGDRFIALVLDSVFLLALCAVVDAWALRRFATVTPDRLVLTSGGLAILAAMSAGVCFAYEWLLEGLFGATLGKAMAGVRVVQTSGRSALASAGIRNLLRIADGVGFFLLGAVVASFTRLRQRLGDLAAGTVVVEEEPGMATKACVLLLWLGGIAAAGWALPRVAQAPLAPHAAAPGRQVVELQRTPGAVSMRMGKVRFEVQFAPAAAVQEASAEASAGQP